MLSDQKVSHPDWRSVLLWHNPCSSWQHTAGKKRAKGFTGTPSDIHNEPGPGIPVFCRLVPCSHCSSKKAVPMSRGESLIQCKLLLGLLQKTFLFRGSCFCEKGDKWNREGGREGSDEPGPRRIPKTRKLGAQHRLLLVRCQAGTTRD